MGGSFWQTPASAAAGDLGDLGDVWKQDTEPSLPSDGDVWLDTWDNDWKVREGGAWVAIDAPDAGAGGVGRIIPISATISSVTVGDTINVVVDSPFGIDADGDPYYDSSGAAPGEEVWLVLDRSTCTYQLIPWCGADLDAPAGSGAAIADPDLAAPDYTTRTLLTIPTYDGSGQTVHPDVVKVRGGWNDWLYWMAVTPFPNGDDDFENPSILVSNDGTTWEAPTGLTNPVIPFPGGTAYNSDPDLVIDGDTAWLFYRESKSGTGSYDRIYVTSSTDGVTWTTPTLLFSGAFTFALSPAVVKDGATWKMWSVDMTTSPNAVNLRTSTSPTGTWSAPTACTLDPGATRDVWHLDVIKDGPTLRAILNTSPRDADGISDARLVPASSTDGTTWSVGADVVVADGSGWDGTSIYRGTALFEQDRWRLWYGGVSSSNEWRTGYTELDPNDFP